MSTLLEKLERQARALTPSEKASLAHTLIEELDSVLDADVEQAWVEEAQRRYDAFRRGELHALPGEAVMQRARTRLK